MATSDNSKPIADPEEFELESKRVTNKLRSELDRLIPEDIGIPLLRYALRSELDRTKGYVRLVRITGDGCRSQG